MADAQSSAASLVASAETKLAQKELSDAEYNSAIDDLGAAIKIDKKFAPAYKARAKAFFDNRWRSTYPWPYVYSADDYSTAIKLNPGDADAYFRRGMAWYQLEQDPYAGQINIDYSKFSPCKAAAKDFFKAIDLGIRTSEFYYYLGKALDCSGLRDGAVGAWIEAVKANTQPWAVVKSYRSLADRLVEQKRYPEAIQLRKKVIELAPEYADLYSELGNVQRLSGDIDGALLSFGKALEKTATQSDAIKARNEIYTERKNFRQIVSDCTNYLNKIESVFVLSDRARAFLELGEYDNALDDMNRAIARMNFKPDFYRLRAAIYRKLGKDGLAAADEDKAATFKQ